MPAIQLGRLKRFNNYDPVTINKLVMTGVNLAPRKGIIPQFINHWFPSLNLVNLPTAPLTLDFEKLPISLLG